MPSFRDPVERVCRLLWLLALLQGMNLMATIVLLLR